MAFGILLYRVGLEKVRTKDPLACAGWYFDSLRRPHHVDFSVPMGFPLRSNDHGFNMSILE